MSRRLALTCGVLLFTDLAATTVFVNFVAIITLVIEQETKAYANPFLSAFTTVCCWQGRQCGSAPLCADRRPPRCAECRDHRPSLRPSVLLFVIYLLLLDAEFTSGSQAVAISVLLMLANLLLVATIVVETSVHLGKEQGRNNRSERMRGLNNGGNPGSFAVVFGGRGGGGEQPKMGTVVEVDRGSLEEREDVSEYVGGGGQLRPA